MNEKNVDYLVQEMDYLIKWATAYEEGNPIENDRVYDAQVRVLQRLRVETPDKWALAVQQRPLFEDNAWTYTGLFIHG
jgi:hypothetical protein